MAQEAVKRDHGATPTTLIPCGSIVTCRPASGTETVLMETAPSTEVQSAGPAEERIVKIGIATSLTLTATTPAGTLAWVSGPTTTAETLTGSMQHGATPPTYL